MEFMDEVMFIGIDIPKAVKNMLKSINACEGMKYSEKTAYDMGVKNALSALKTILSTKEDYEVCVHIPGKDVCEEFDYDDLKKIIL